jgi:FkbM family methyltransferase
MLFTLRKFLPRPVRQQLKRKLFAVQDVQTRLENLKKAGFCPRGFIDSGAFRGEWANTAWGVWRAPAILVEPQGAQRAILERIVGKVPGSEVITAALGAEDGTALFTSEATNSRLSQDGTGTRVQIFRLETLLAQRPSFSPDLVKLDLQGHELQALQGAGKQLARFEVILLEISLIRIGPVPVFHEVEEFMASRGFIFYDVVPQYYRPRDGALWQMDAFYVRNDSLLVSSTSWD